MKDTNTGGPAFPQDYGHTKVIAQMFDSGELTALELQKATRTLAGMTLRDYFAAKAMQGLITSASLSRTESWYDEERVAESAYKMADAMLKARAS